MPFTKRTTIKVQVHSPKIQWAQKIGNGWDARDAVVHALMYSTIFYSRDKQICTYCLDFIDNTTTINQQTTDNTLDWVGLVYHWSVWAWEAHLRSVLLCSTHLDTPTINQQTTDNTLDWVGLVYHQSVWAWKAHLRSVTLCSTHHASSKRELFTSLQELFTGPAISSSAFWVSKDLEPLKFFLLLVHCIIRTTAMQHLEFMTMSFTLHHMPGSCSGADGHKVATMYGTPSATILSQKIQKISYSFESITGNFQ